MSSTSHNVNHTYPTAGTYRVKLIVERGSLSAEDRTTTAVDDIVVTIPPPTVDISGPPSVIRENPVVLTWTTTDATACSINNGIGSVNPSGGSVSHTPLTSTTYTITCSGPGGPNATDILLVTVNIPNPEIILFKANPSTVFKGGQTTLSWNVDNIISGDIGCSASAVPVQSDWTGSVSVPPDSGSQPVTPISSTNSVTYRLTCENEASNITAEAVVTVPLLREVLP